MAIQKEKRIGKLINVKIKFEKELELIKKKLANNLFYEILDIKIEDIKPISEKKVMELSDLTKIHTSTAAKHEIQKEYTNISEHIKSRLKKPLESQKILLEKFQEKRTESKRPLIGGQKKMDEWKAQEKLLRDRLEHVKVREEEVRKEIELVDENMEKFYNSADFLIVLKWRVKLKEGTQIGIGSERTSVKENLLENIESYSLYSLEQGHIFDTLIPNIPTEMKLEKRTIVKSEKSNPEHEAVIEEEYTVSGLGWVVIVIPGIGLIPPRTQFILKIIPFQTYYYKIILKIRSNENFADSSTPKTTEMTFDFDLSYQKHYWLYIGFPMCTLGRNGALRGGPLGIGVGEWRFPYAWGIPYETELKLNTEGDYYEDAVVDYIDGFMFANSIAISVGVGATIYVVDVSASLTFNPPNEVYLCTASGAVGQKISIYIRPCEYLGPVVFATTFTGVFHDKGHLRVCLDNYASDTNKINEVGKIKFNIPVHLFYADYFGNIVTTHKIPRLRFIDDEDPDIDCNLLYYIRYPGIPKPRIFNTITESEILPNQTTEICLTVYNQSEKVNLEDIHIENARDSIDPYLRPVDGDYTNPDNDAERVITPGEKRQYRWTLEVPQITRDQIEESVIITPRFIITYRYGLPVPSTFDEIQEDLDGPEITIKPELKILLDVP